MSTVISRGAAGMGTESVRVIIQIYEIQTAAEALAMLSLGVDHVGGVLLTEADAENLKIRDMARAVADGGGRASLIPLFREPEAIFRALDHHRPHILHLCDALPMGGAGLAEGCEPFIRLQEAARRRFPEVAIMRSIPIGRPGAAHRVPSLALAALFEPVSDWFLTDTLLLDAPAAGAAPKTDQPVAGFVGITGQTCDWDVAAALVAQSRIPVILAGGIGPENVAAGIAAVRPAGVDSCTGTNARDDAGLPIRFRKDPDRVRRMVAAARGP